MVMKKFYFITAIAAIAAFTACQKEITPQSETVTNDTFVFSSVKPSLEEEIATKTEWNGETITWSKDDQIRMAYTVEGVWQGASDSNTAPKLYASSKLEAAAEIAEFTVNSNFTSTATGTHIFYGLYPGSISASSFDNAPVATITIPAEQTPAANSFDSAADLMVGVSEEYSAKPSSEETVLLTWSRQVAHADLTIKNLSIYDGETISNITFTAQEGADLVGLHNIDITTGAVSNAQGTTNEIVVNGNNLVYENNSVKVWLSMLPATLTELTVNVETDKAYYVRSFSGFTREFKKNMHNTMNIGMTSAVRTPKAANLGNYEESFANGQGDFTIKNVTLGSGLSYVWIYDNTYKYEKASAYVSGAAHEAVSYLISPELIIGSNKSKLTFDQAANKLNGAAVKDYFKVVVIEGETETEVAPDVYPLGTDWNFVSSTISLADYNGKTIKIGFKYTSTSSVAGTWEIKNFKVTDVKTKMSPELSFGEITEFEANVGEDFTAPTLTNPNNLTVTYSSSNENVALVDEATGEIVIGAAGVAVITASFAGNDDYNAGSASYTINVIDPNQKFPNPETIVFADLNLENGVQYSDPFDGGDFTVTFGGGGNDGKYYTTGSGIRTYADGTITVASSDYNIVRIDYTFSASTNAPGAYSINTGSLTTGAASVWTGSAKSVVLTNSASSGHWRLQSVKVTFGEATVPTLYSINLTSVQNGTIAIEGGFTEAEAGTTITLEATPAEGYVFGEWTVLDREGNVVTVTEDQFTMPESDVTVSATFKVKTSSGGRVTFTAGTDTGETSVTKDGITVSMSTMSRSDNYRTYANTDMTISAASGKTITKVEVTCTASGTSNYGPGKFSGDGYSYNGTVGTWSGSATSVSLSASAQVRITEIVVTYN